MMYRLLIADDEEEIRNGLAECFPWSEVGFEVAAVAEDGQQALTILREGNIDVLLADIRMPNLSGVELARAIFEERLCVTVVFLSAYRDFSYAQKAIEYGIKRYILKPTEYAEIAAVFSELKRELDGGVGHPNSDSLESKEAPPADRSQDLVELIKSYIAREYPRATLEGAARVVHLNAQYTSRLFATLTGEHFNEYLIKVKMTKAAELLQDPRYRTHEVSEIVGYSNPKNFTRSFKRYFGVPPRDFRHAL